MTKEKNTEKEKTTQEKTKKVKIKKEKNVKGKDKKIIRRKRKVKLRPEDKDSLRQYYTSGQFAEKIGKNVKTVQRWDESGVLPARRDLSNNRYYTEEDVSRVFNIKSIMTPAQIDEFIRIIESGDHKPPYDKDDLREYVRGVCKTLEALNYNHNWLFGYKNSKKPYLFDILYTKWSKTCFKS